MENLTILFGSIIAIGLTYQLISQFIFRRAINNHKNYAQEIREMQPLVSILKPIKGIDDQLESNLESFFKLDYPNYEIIFGLHSKEDPAHEIILKIMDKNPEVKSKLIINEHKIGLNPKINNMHNMYPYAEGEYLLISDSNTRVEKRFLTLLMNEFTNERTGLVTATIRGKGAKNIPSIMENIHLNSFLATSVFASAKLAKISIVIGKAMLIPRSLLNKIGGFEYFKSYLAEDYMMGSRIEELGYEIRTTNIFVDNINEQLSFKKFLNRHSRWAKMRARIRLNTYLLESFSNPIASSFILMLILQNEIGISQFFIISAIKTLIDLFTLRIVESDIKWYQTIIIPLKDLIIGILWIVPFLNSEVTWRDNSFRIEKDSMLQPITADS